MKKKKVNIRQVIQRRQVTVFKRLLNQHSFSESYLTRKNKQGNTLLHEAAQCGSYFILRLLLNQFFFRGFAVPSDTNKLGFTPFMLAVMSGAPKSIRALKDYDPDPFTSERDFVLATHAAMTGDKALDAFMDPVSKPKEVVGEIPIDEPP